MVRSRVGVAIAAPRARIIPTPTAVGNAVSNLLGIQSRKLRCLL
jgi:hypothetical protein